MYHNKFTDINHTPGVVQFVYVPESGLFRSIDANDIFPISISGNLSQVSGSEVVVDNPYYNTIGFHIKPPSGATVQFQGSFDGVNFSPITLRQIGADGYCQCTEAEEDYLGSIAALKSIKFKTTVSGFNAGSYAGRMVKEVSTLEGMEHSAPPHKFGHELWHTGFAFTNQTGINLEIYTPPSGYSFVITYLTFGAYSTAGSDITFHEDGLGVDKWVFSTYIKSNLNDSKYIDTNLTSPYVASAPNVPLNLDLSAETTIRGVLHGFNVKS